MAGPIAQVTVDTKLLETLISQLDPRATAVISKAAMGVEAKAKELAPVDTGALRASIFTAIENGGLTAYVGPTVEYAVYQELGTRKMKAHPFLVPALESVREAFLAAWKELIG